MAAARRHILVVANETVAGRALLEKIKERVAGHAEDVLVVCPALNSRLRSWVSDVDGARGQAHRRLDESLSRLSKHGVRARGAVGDGDPLQAMSDALCVFPADEIIISTHPPGRSNWLEKRVVERARARYDIPIEHIVVDLEAEQALAEATPGIGEVTQPQTSALGVAEPE